MRVARRLSLVILVLSLLFSAAGTLWLLVLSGNSFGTHSDALARFGMAVSEAQDISVLKQACFSLAALTEEERISRLNFVFGTGGMLIVLGVVSAIASAWQLVVLRRFSNATRESQ